MTSHYLLRCEKCNSRVTIYSYLLYTEDIESLKENENLKYILSIFAFIREHFCSCSASFEFYDENWDDDDFNNDKRFLLPKRALISNIDILTKKLTLLKRRKFPKPEVKYVKQDANLLMLISQQQGVIENLTKQLEEVKK